MTRPGGHRSFPTQLQASLVSRSPLQFCPGARTGQGCQARVGPAAGAFFSHVDRTIASTDSHHPRAPGHGQVLLVSSPTLPFSVLASSQDPISEIAASLFVGVQLQFDPGRRRGRSERGTPRNGEGQRVLRRPGGQH